MEIKIKELLDILEILQKSLSKFESVNLGEKEYFWEIYEDELYDPYQSPKQLGLGKLSDDWEELLRLKNIDEIPITYDLKRMGNIFRGIQDNGNIALS